jgi:hypothetical protein
VAVPTGTQPITDQGVKLAYIAGTAQRLGLDPAAVIAVSGTEGLSGGIGDNGTSFGPFQLHVPGRYNRAITDAGAPPLSDPNAANAWANSPVGITWALEQMAAVARGLTGASAINSIVYNFEAPADKPKEVRLATANYGKATALLSMIKGGGVTSSLGGLIGNTADGANSLLTHVPGVQQTETAVGGAASAIDSIGKFLSKITTVSFLLRAGEVIAGAVLLLAGLYLMSKQVGLAPGGSPRGAPGPAGDAAGWTTEQAEEAQRRAEASFAAGRSSVEPHDVRDEREHKQARKAAVAERVASSAATDDIPF